MESRVSAASANVLNVNDAAIGSVAISGLVEQGQILTASNNLTDADGLGTISYTWKADGSVIGSGSSFTLGQAHVGKAISVVASYTDGHGTVESVTSAATASVANVNDAVTGTVTISGLAEQGQILTASNTLSDIDGLGAISYAWKANGLSIGSGPSFTLTEAQVGKTISVVASYTDGHGTIESVTSAATTSVANVNDAVTGSVSISGLVEQGQILTASNTLADIDGLGAISYTWQADGSVIGSGGSFTLTEAQVGKIISVLASYTDGHGTVESRVSAATTNVANVNDAAIGSVSISGLVEQGQILTASNTLSDIDGLGAISYAWKANGLSIGSGPSFTLTEAQVGKTISVVASYTDGHGTIESVTSAATTSVANVNDAVTGSVSISGLVEQGQILTASNTLADADGLRTITYTWKADGTPIGSGASFTLTEAQVGKIISVVASYTDGHGTFESVTSASTANVANLNDTPIGSVTVSGTAAQGQILTASNNLTDADGLGAISYTWKADGNVIGSGNSFTLTEAQVGKSISVLASYTDGHGTVESRVSAATANVLNVNDAAIGSVSISGLVEQGQILTVSNNLTDADGLGAISYTWKADGTTVGSGGSFTLGQAQVGKAISVVASYTDGHGTVESVSSAATTSVANINDTVTGTVTITAAPSTQTLTSNTVMSFGGNAAIITSPIVISSMGTISDINVQINLTHTWMADVVATLIHPDGTRIILANQVGSNGDNFNNTIFDQQAAASITTGLAPFVGSFRPSGDLSLLNGKSLNGTWKLELQDVFTAADNGTLNSWSITATTGSGYTQGQTLTASNTLSDIDGLGVISYQWKANGVNINGANYNSLLLSEAQVGKGISLTASYLDGFGSLESKTSVATPVIANINDLPTGIVVIGGLTEQNQILTASNTLNDADGLGLVSYTWKNQYDTVIGTGDSLLLGEAHVGKYISCTATYTDGHGTLESKTSAATALVSNINDAPTGSVSVSGIAMQGQVLSMSHNLLDADGLGFVSYMWQDDTGLIISASQSFTLSYAQVGKQITGTAYYTDGHGTEESVLSAPTATVLPHPGAPTGEVLISGAAIQHQTLTVSHNLQDPDGLGNITYTWRDSDGYIQGYGTNLTLNQSHVGKSLSVLATYTDGQGIFESATSSSTALVANVNDAPTGTLSIGGYAAPGQELFVQFGLSDTDGYGPITFTWTDNLGVTLATHSFSYWSPGVISMTARLPLTQAMRGKTIHLTATYVDGGGTTEVVSALPSAPVAYLNVSGLAAEDQALTADHNIVGIPGLMFEWIDANGMMLGIGQTLNLGDAHVGKNIRVRAVFYDAYNVRQEISSSPTAPVANVNDAPVGEVIINGTLEVGENLFVNLSNITDADGFTGYGLMDPSTNFQWFADGQAVGNNAPSLTLSANEAGKSISVQVSYVDAHGTAETITQSLNGLVVDPYDINIGFSGLAEQGQVLTATHTLSDTTGWNFAWIDAEGMFHGMGPTLTLSEAQVGKSLSVRASFWESLPWPQPGVLHESSSSLTSPVANVNDAPVGAVNLIGNLLVGQSLFADTYTITDADGFTGYGLMDPSTHFQWLADGQAVGNDAPSLTLTAAQAGKHISVQVSYVDAHGTLEHINSALSAMVINPFV